MVHFNAHTTLGDVFSPLTAQEAEHLSLFLLQCVEDAEQQGRSGLPEDEAVLLAYGELQRLRAPGGQLLQ